MKSRSIVLVSVLILFVILSISYSQIQPGNAQYKIVIGEDRSVSIQDLQINQAPVQSVDKNVTVETSSLMQLRLWRVKGF